MAEPVSSEPSPDARTADDAGGSVAVFRDLWKSFGEKTVLRGVTLEAPRGEVTVVLGGSGSGKTTLLRILLGLEGYDRGSVQLFGHEVREMDRATHDALMRRVGMLFQFGALFDSLSVADNVGFALRYAWGRDPDEIAEVVREKLLMVGLKQVEGLMPAQLSGGMRKRVALARAIAHQPQLLCVDEPTSGLDPIMSDTINELILQMKERLGATVLCITHDLDATFKIADRVALLYQGRVIACGTPDEVKASDDEIVQQFITGRAHGPIAP
ncbi:MAG: ABC transporter ATP-binding protein [Myxococcota bacterium]|nr:ABC transporter ATP-binding protein [Myxococcota bacterium]